MVLPTCCVPSPLACLRSLWMAPIHKGRTPFLKFDYILNKPNLYQRLRSSNQNSLKSKCVVGLCTNQVDRIRGIFDPLPPSQTLLLNSSYQVKQTFDQPPSPLTCLRGLYTVPLQGKVLQPHLMLQFSEFVSHQYLKANVLYVCPPF